MDDKRELNDILMGGDDNRSNQSKKIVFLIIGIIVLIVAIIAIIISMLNSNNKPETLVLNKGQENTDISIPQNPSMINNVPINESEEDKFEKIVEEIKSQYQQNSTSVEKSQEVLPKATIPVKKAEKKQQAIPTIKQQKAPQQVRVVNRSNNGDIATSGYYLQVGAFSKAPNKEFIDKINVYSYRIQEILINSKVITRYLIGPYKNRADAQKDYENISRDIATPIYLQIQ